MVHRNLSPDDAVNGFTRLEMDTGNLTGTVDAYDRHVFLYYNNHVSWPTPVEADPLLNLVAATWKARKNDITLMTKITVCEAREDADFSDGDVLIFPEMIKYRGLVESNVESFFEDVLVNGKPWTAGVPEMLTGSHVYVCAHGSRNERCGVCGPVLINKFDEEIELRGLKDQITVTACSHVGGHKHAGNLTIYSPGPDGKTMGHWYGYVTPDDVPDMLDQHIAKGELVRRLWRGQMGPSVVEVKGKNNHVESEDARIRKNVVRPYVPPKREYVVHSLSSDDEDFFGSPEPAQIWPSWVAKKIADDEKLADGEDTKGKISNNRPVLKERGILTVVGVIGAGIVAAVAMALKLKMTKKMKMV